MHFRDRYEAGKKFAEALASYRGQDVVVYALPRGGVILGYEIAKALGAPLDLIISRKIGYPSHEEFAIGAVAEDGHMVLDQTAATRVDPNWIYSKAEEERQEAKRRREVYLSGLNPLSVEGKTAIIVDDGVATGLTLMLAIGELKHRQPKKIVVAVPVASSEASDMIKQAADELVVLDVPVYFEAVGAYYDKFPQITDEEVIDLMKKSRS
jgi:putative phosphoribosyl transferase